MAESKSKILRQLIEGPELFTLAYGANALHARIAEQLGYKAFGLSGGWSTAYMLGRPDASYISLQELAMLARYIVLATDFPVLSDIDQGFGNAVTTHHTIQVMINAGCAGIHIEDQPFPKRCGFVEGKQVIPMEEMVGKLRAAWDAKMKIDPDFVIIARVDALTTPDGGLEEAVRRSNAYLKEGRANAIYMEGPRSVEEIRQIHGAVDGPLFCTLNSIEPWPSIEELRELGECLILGEFLCEPAIVATWNALEAFQQRGMAAWNDFLQENKDHPLTRLRHFDLLGFPQIRELEDKYLPAEQLKKYEYSTGPYKMGR